MKLTPLSKLPSYHPRRIADHYAQTGQFYRLRDEDLEAWDKLGAVPSVGPDGAMGLHLSADDLVAISRKAFARIHSIDVSTVSRWMEKGLDAWTLSDGYFPMESSGEWVERYHRHVAAIRSYGRVDDHEFGDRVI